MEKIGEEQRIVDAVNAGDEAAYQKNRADDKEGVEGMKIRFEALTEQRLPQVTALVNEVFALEGDTAGKDLATAIGVIDRSNAAAMYTDARYWVALDDANNVIGVTGIYGLANDLQEHSWLGWFAVKPELHGQRAGEKMIEFTTEEARKAGKTDLFIITTDHPDMAGNAMFYHRNQCPVVAVLDSAGNHIGNEGKTLPLQVIRANREYYQSFIDEGLRVMIRRRKLAEPR